MLESTCTLPLSADLFAQAIHPSEPVLAVGLSTGHVQTFRIPTSSSSDAHSRNNESEDDDGADHSLLSQGRGEIATQWRTRRHKISCRALAYSTDGTALYSAGADGVLKAASAVTGQVFAKLAVPAVNAARIQHQQQHQQQQQQQPNDACSLLHVLSPQTLLLGTDQSCALHLYDLRVASSTTQPGATPSPRPAQTFHPHADYVSSLTPLPTSAASTSGFAKQWLTTGGTTLALTDARKGIVAQSAEQDDELTASCFVAAGLPRGRTSVGQKAVVGGAGGVVSLWERGVWDDLDERIVLDRSSGGGGGKNSSGGMQGEAGESVEVLVNVPRESSASSGSAAVVAAGMGGGLVMLVQLGKNKVVESYRHDEVEAVLGLGFDVEGRMISGGGQIVKIWSEKMEEESDVDRDTNGAIQNGDSHDSEDEPDESDKSSSSEDERPRKKRKKGKAGRKPSLGQFQGLD